MNLSADARAEACIVGGWRMDYVRPANIAIVRMFLDVDIVIQKEDRAAWTIAIDRTMEREVDDEG